MSDNIPSGNSRGKQGLSLYKTGFIDDTSQISMKLSLEREYNSISNAFLTALSMIAELEKRIDKLENP